MGLGDWRGVMCQGEDDVRGRRGTQKEEIASVARAPLITMLLRGGTGGAFL